MQHINNRASGSPEEPSTPDIIRVWHDNQPTVPQAMSEGRPTIIRHWEASDTPTAPTPSEFDGIDVVQTEKTEAVRVSNILSNTPDEVLNPDLETYTHITSRDNAIGIAKNGLYISDFDLTTTAWPLFGSQSSLDYESLREHNARQLAEQHRDSTHAIVIQFPPEMPTEVRKRYEESAARGFGTKGFNAYIERRADPNNPQKTRRILPVQYIAGVVDQHSGQYWSRNQFLAAFETASQ